MVHELIGAFEGRTLTETLCNKETDLPRHMSLFIIKQLILK